MFIDDTLDEIKIEENLLKEKLKNLPATSMIIHSSEERDKRFKRFVPKNIFQCDVCDYKAKKKSALTDHLLSMHGGQMYKCDLCEKEFKWKTYVNAHKKSVHFKDDQPKFSCDLCPFESTEKKKLTRHKQSKHEGVKYPCSMCDKQFSFKVSLNKHVKTVH